MPRPLSDIERRILDYMVRYLRTHTFQPSIREIGEEFGIKSTKTVSEYLACLADKGYLERTSSRSRGVRILGVDLNPQTVSVPCYRELPRGDSGPAENRAEAYLSMDRRLAGPVGSYLVRIRGDDLAALGVSAGDYVLMEPLDGPDQVREGDLVVARRDRTPPRFHRAFQDADGLLLQPLHGPGTPLRPEAEEEVEVTGRAVALHRRLDDASVTMSPTAH